MGTPGDFLMFGTCRCVAAGMAVEFRQACELGFRCGAISVLVATSTVATGINLPAQRVIVRDLFLGQRDNILDSSKMRQMAGRAGRSGIDSKGEAIFIVSRREPPSRLQQTMNLLAAPVRPLLPQHGPSEGTRHDSCSLEPAIRQCDWQSPLWHWPHVLAACCCQIPGVARCQHRLSRCTCHGRHAAFVAAVNARCVGPGFVTLVPAANLVKQHRVQPNPVSSCLSADKRGMQRLMLEVVASGCVRSPADVKRLIECTLLSAEHSQGSQWQENVAQGCIQGLKVLGSQGFLAWEPAPDGSDGGGGYRPLPLGLAAVAASLAPEAALMINEDARSVSSALNIESDLHLMYLVAPAEPNPHLQWSQVAAALQKVSCQGIVRRICKHSEINLDRFLQRASSMRKGWAPEVRRRLWLPCTVAASPELWKCGCGSCALQQALVRWCTCLWQSLPQ